MPNVGDILRANHWNVLPAQQPHQHIPINIANPIANVRLRIHRQPAGVHANRLPIERLGFIFVAREGVVEFQGPILQENWRAAMSLYL